MPLLRGIGKRVISRNISEMIHSGRYSQKQAVAAALSYASSSAKKKSPSMKLKRRH